MIVAEQVGKVGIGLLQRQHDFLAAGLDALDALHVAERAGLRLFVGMALERGGDVLGGHGLAVVEFDAVADLQRPDLGVVRRADLLGDAVLELAVGRQLDDHFAPHLAEGERHLGHDQRRIEAVGGFAADQAGLEDAALDRACGARRAGEQRIGEGSGDAERGGAAKKIAPAHFAFGDVAAQEFEFVGHDEVPHSVGIDRGHSFVRCGRNIDRNGKAVGKAECDMPWRKSYVAFGPIRLGRQIWSRGDLLRRNRVRKPVCRLHRPRFGP